jgi:hypothetical protein
VPLADWSDFVTRFQAMTQGRVLIGQKSMANNAVQGRFSSGWLIAPLAGAAPTTAAAPTRATTGAHPFDAWTNSGSLTTFCIGGNLASNVASSGSGGMFLLMDRLSHQGGLSGTTTGAQTTNLPTAALTRFTSGEGVWLGLEIYTAIGATATTVTASYTNSAGTSGKTTQAVTFGGSGFQNPGRIVFLPLADGDTGVRAVASVTLAASTTTAGAFGVTLLKPIAAFALAPTQEQFDPFIAGNMVGLAPIPNDACLQMVGTMASNTSTGPFTGDVILTQV